MLLERDISCRAPANQKALKKQANQTQEKLAKKPKTTQQTQEFNLEPTSVR